MKIMASRAAFASAVAWAARSVASNPLLPVLSGIHISAGEDGVAFAGFDYDVSSRAVIPADQATVFEQGACLVSGKMLAEISKVLDEDDVELVVDDDNATLTCGQDVWTLHLMAVEDFPALPELGEPIGEVDADELARLVRQAGHAASKPGGVELYTGVLLEGDEQTLSMVSTDQYRMPVATTSWATDGLEKPVRLLVAPRVLSDFTSADLAGPVLVSTLADKNGSYLVGLSCGGRQSTARLISGADGWVDWRGYYTRLLEGTTTATVDAKPLLKVLTKAATVIKDVPGKSGTVFLDIDADGITVSGAGDSSKFVRPLVATVEGEPLKVKMNLRYLAEAVKYAESTVVRFVFTTPTKPFVMVPLVERPRHWHVLMPLRAA